MKIATQDISTVLAEYVDAHVAPKASGAQKFGAYFLLFVVGNKMPEIVERYAPTMRMAGIMGDDGMIDLEFLHQLAADAMGRAGNVNLLGFVVDGSDVESVYAIAQRHAR